MFDSLTTTDPSTFSDALPVEPRYLVYQRKNFPRLVGSTDSKGWTDKSRWKKKDEVIAPPRGGIGMGNGALPGHSHGILTVDFDWKEGAPVLRKAWHRRVARHLDSLTETSMSGNGLHVFLQVPADAKLQNKELDGGSLGKMDVLWDGRYTALTERSPWQVQPIRKLDKEEWETVWREIHILKDVPCDLELLAGDGGEKKFKDDSSRASFAWACALARSCKEHGLTEEGAVSTMANLYLVSKAGERSDFCTPKAIQAECARAWKTVSTEPAAAPAQQRKLSAYEQAYNAIKSSGLGFRRDTFSGRDTIDGEDRTDEVDRDIRHRFCRSLSLRVTLEALERILDENKVDSLREYLDGVKWDGVERLNAGPAKYLGAADEELNREMFRKWMIGAVARAYDPGSKVDAMLVLAGGQGIGKSTFLSILGDELYSDSSAIFTGSDKEALEASRGVWIAEHAELVGAGKREVEAIKARITATSQTARMAYARNPVTVKRRYVLAGTTNNTGFLRDETGSRRFWVIDCRAKEDDIQERMALLKEDRAQLFAEAKHAYQAGERPYLSPNLGKELNARNAKRLEFEPEVAAEVDGLVPETKSDGAPFIPLQDVTKKLKEAGLSSKAAGARRYLQSLGFEKQQFRHGGGRVRAWVWTGAPDDCPLGALPKFELEDESQPDYSPSKQGGKPARPEHGGASSANSGGLLIPRSPSSRQSPRPRRPSS